MTVPQNAKSPNFARFILTGAIVGFVFGAVLVLSGVLGPEAPGPTGYEYGPTDGLGIVSLFFAAIFALVAAVIAVLIDRRNL